MDALSSFNEYERDFLALSQQLPVRISTVMTYSNDAEALAELRRVETDLAQARQRLADMEMEARGLPAPTRAELGNKVRTYKGSLDTVSADLQRAKDKHSRAALLAGGTAASTGAGGRPLEFGKSLDHRARMDATAQKMRGGNQLLGDANTRIAEMTDVGEATMSELARNRETLMRVRGNVGVVSGTLDEARAILRSMSSRELRTKIALGVFAVVLIGIIIGVIVYMVQKKSS